MTIPYYWVDDHRVFVGHLSCILIPPAPHSSLSLVSPLRAPTSRAHLGGEPNFGKNDDIRTKSYQKGRILEDRRVYLTPQKARTIPGI